VPSICCNIKECKIDKKATIGKIFYLIVDINLNFDFINTDILYKFAILYSSSSFFGASMIETQASWKIVLVEKLAK